MRPPRRSWLLLFLGPAFAVSVCSVAPAAPRLRTLAFINEGTQPVYAIRIGHRASGAWSADLLGPADVVDVGDAQRLRVELADTCWYDVRFEYRDGVAGELDDVDLCSANRVFLKATPWRSAALR
jgi:hypothetical protein